MLALVGYLACPVGMSAVGMSAVQGHLPGGMSALAIGVGISAVAFPGGIRLWLLHCLFLNLLALLHVGFNGILPLAVGVGMSAVAFPVGIRLWLLHCLFLNLLALLHVGCHL